MSPSKGGRRWRNQPVVRERDVERSRWRWILLAWFLAAAAPLTAYLLEQGLGQSTVVGIGGDPVVGSTFVDVLKMFNQDESTDAVVIVGEIGGTKEEDAAEYIRDEMSKPVAAFIAGQTAPPGRRMGHAGAIISGGKGTAAEKMKALRAADIHVSESPAGIGATVQEVL